ncbi:hypothetical protein GCM10008171_33140 [Methylopila jiangsuensis]|uniref:Uncharacterized protein n=1 Tax=Methylopila jiangsuensis TaxID=586230 RepID=A0A9W6JI50_9HYPH|nr:hypothetical protein [Methylopila jiangsuensis]MDR6284552.1 hypothetical protein [Methylopila jiangsuensis]GLK78060.1 hypothetical protein GCM10008171_33140 [Methylopila jiangsuensis]
MKTLVLTVPDSGASFAGAGNGSIPTLETGPTAFAAYFFGSDFLDVSGRPTEMIAGRNVIVSGDPTLSARHARLDRLNCYRTEWTATELIAAGDGSGYTLIAMARAEAASNFPLISNFVNSSTPYGQVIAHASALARGYSGVPAQSVDVAASDPGRGARWGAYAVTVTNTRVTIYERHAGSEMISALVAFSSRAIGSANGFRMGGHYLADFAGAGDMAHAAFHSAPLTAAQVASEFDALRDYYALIGMAV